jgi:hypothetical protein
VKPLDLFGSGVQSYSAVVTSQRRLNCFYDLRKDGDKYRVAVVGTPGLTLASTLPPGTVRGWWAVGTTLYIVSGSSVYTYTTIGTLTRIGGISTSAGKISMADNGVQVIIVDGIAGYIITISGATLSTISDGNFPNGAATVAFLNGRFFCELPNSRQFFESQSYDGTNWTPATFGTKENSSDKLLACQTFNGMLILWGASTTEFWQDVGTTPLTVARITGTTQTWGLAAIHSTSQVNNQQYFLGVRPEGGYQIARLNGYVPEAVSTSDIDSIINTFSTVSDAVSLAYTVYGHPMYQITFPTAQRSFLFDTVSNIWSEVQTGLALQARHVAELGVVFNNQVYVSDYSSGNVYTLSPNVYTDNGLPIKRQVRTKHLHNGGARFNLSEIFLDMEVGVGLQSGQGSAPLLMLQVSKDGGQTFGIERRLSLGYAGTYLTRLVARRFGQARDFVLQITMTDPVKFLIVSGSGTVAQQEGS